MCHSFSHGRQASCSPVNYSDDGKRRCPAVHHSARERPGSVGSGLSKQCANHPNDVRPCTWSALKSVKPGRVATTSSSTASPSRILSYLRIAHGTLCQRRTRPWQALPRALERFTTMQTQPQHRLAAVQCYHGAGKPVSAHHSAARGRGLRATAIDAAAVTAKQGSHCWLKGTDSSERAPLP